MDAIAHLVPFVSNFRGIHFVSIALPNEFTPSTKTNLERIIFIIETENRRIREIKFQRICKTPTIHESWPHRI